MTRCNTCNGIIKKTDSECFTCSEPIPGRAKAKRFQASKPEAQAKVAVPVTPLTNLLFVASLVLTGVSFLSSQKMPLSVSVALSGGLFIARLVVDRKATPRLQVSESASAASQVPPELLRRMTLG